MRNLTSSTIFGSKMVTLHNTLTLWLCILNIFIGLQNEYHNDHEGFSGHDMPFVVRKSTMPEREAIQVWRKNYKNYNLQSFNGYLWQLPWSVINVFEDPQVM